MKKKRVGSLSVTMWIGGSNDRVGIGDRWEAQVEGQITALASSPSNLFVGTSRGIVSRLETVTGRRCARTELSGPIDKLSVKGPVVKVSVEGAVTELKSSSLKPRPVPGRARGGKHQPR
ncbi:MAG: hypothetical protein QM831_09055 [Kofleriaceae bacterium]